MNNWIDHIFFHLRTQPERPAIVMEERVVTYAMLRSGLLPTDGENSYCITNCDEDVFTSRIGRPAGDLAPEFPRRLPRSGSDWPEDPSSRLFATAGAVRPPRANPGHRRCAFLPAPAKCCHH